MDGVKIDGNNILSVYDTIKGVRNYCIENQKPYLIECMTFRMRGHEEASGTKYVPSYLFDIWKEKDPIKNFEDFLLAENVLSASTVESIRNEFKQTIEDELKIGFDAKPMVVDTEEEVEDVFSTQPPKSPQGGLSNTQPLVVDNSAISSIIVKNDNISEVKSPLWGVGGRRFIDGISEGLKQSMQKHPSLIIMGQDIAEYGGAFKITEGFVQEFGKERIRNTPICESAIVGAALGLSLEGYKAVMEMQFADFVTVGFNQIVNNLAKMHYRWGQNADVVVRMPTGAGVGAGPFHSQSNEAWFTKVPGLKIVYPSTPMDAKGLLIAAINDPNPVMYFEHKALYRSVTGNVPEEYYEIEIGKARHVRSGDEISIITYGAGVHWAEDYAAEHPEISIDILDLRSLAPLDYAAIRAAVQRTGRVVILHEDTLIGGIGGEIAAWIAEHCFALLDAPVMRCASLDTPIPFNIELAQNFLAKGRLGEMVEKLMSY